MMEFCLQFVLQRWKRNPLQDAENMLHVAILAYNLQWFHNVTVIGAKSRTISYN